MCVPIYLSMYMRHTFNYNCHVFGLSILVGIAKVRFRYCILFFAAYKGRHVVTVWNYVVIHTSVLSMHCVILCSYI